MVKVLSMRGQPLDMARMAMENAMQPALGNASMNARGDVISPRGEVVRSREEITRDYNSNNPKSVRQIALRDIKTDVFVSPAEAIATAQVPAETKPRAKRKMSENA